MNKGHGMNGMKKRLTQNKSNSTTQKLSKTNTKLKVFF
jgi:hypothetical protein